MNAYANHTVRRFDSIGAYLTHCTAAHNPEGESSTTGSKWHGTDSFDQAISLCRDGWHTVRPKVDAMLAPLRAKLADTFNVETVRIHDIVGSEPDIDRFLQGEVECMLEDFQTETLHGGKVFTVLVSDAVNSGVSGDTLLARGVTILALIEAFQILGYDLEVWIETSSAKGDTALSSVVCIHKAGETMDIDSVMFPLANPSWLRRFYFAAAEGEPSRLRTALGVYPEGHGYGSAKSNLTAETIPDLSFTIDKGDTKMDADPMGWIVNTLTAQGVYAGATNTTGGK